MPVNKTYGQQAVIHRADLHNALITRALAQPTVTLRENSLVTDVTFDPPSVTLASGEIVRGDIVIGADGIKSGIRAKLLEDDSVKAQPTGDAAYRIMLDRSVMEADPELRELIREPQATRWIGPYRHVIAYPVRKHELYNVVLIHPDRHGVEESWTTKGSKQRMIDDYRGWDSKVTKLIDLVPDDEVLEWKLCLHSPLETWIRGCVALIGDACHPMLSVPTPSHFPVWNQTNKKQPLRCSGRRPSCRRRRSPRHPPLNHRFPPPNPPRPNRLRAIPEAACRDRPAVWH